MYLKYITFYNLTVSFFNCSNINNDKKKNLFFYNYVNNNDPDKYLSIFRNYSYNISIYFFLLGILFLLPSSVKASLQVALSQADLTERIGMNSNRL